ncbi:DUF5131 family protein [uncultured Cocleimonas sp.]|uniref:DUF5131 family protein n=1 Tax=uncultured Cocleimonas sp. TaxID=1051587 RepID=UPI0026027E3E|nr:phage Gp37/Gp68 family protein [uncultured Cocleimonas sp.]
MSGTSKIEWTERTWNPVTGCTKISAGCKYCYAESMAHRLKAMGTNGYENGFELSLMPERLSEPLNRRSPTIYFVNSMSDLFHEGVPDDYIEMIIEVISRTPQHTYQILTKRPERMVSFFENRIIPKNAWLGVTVENEKEGKPRIDLLRQVKAHIRFLSIEPLLENVSPLNLSGINWVIVGGESGANARPMKGEWVESIKDDCQSYDVRFFFKQWGRYGADGVARSKKANGRKFNGMTWDDMPNPSQYNGEIHD